MNGVSRTKMNNIMIKVDENKMPKLFRAKDLEYAFHRTGKYDFIIVLVALYKKNGKNYALTPSLKILEEYSEKEGPEHVKICNPIYSYSNDGMSNEDWYKNNKDTNISFSNKISEVKLYLDIDITEKRGFSATFKITGNDKILQPHGTLTLKEIKKYEEYANKEFQKEYPNFLNKYKKGIEQEKKENEYKKKIDAKTYDDYPTF